MVDTEARKQKVGGELLCTVYGEEREATTMSHESEELPDQARRTR